MRVGVVRLGSVRVGSVRVEPVRVEPVNPTIIGMRGLKGTSEMRTIKPGQSLKEYNLISI